MTIANPRLRDQGASLFTEGSETGVVMLRIFDAAAAEAELRLVLQDVITTVERLDEAQVVSQDLLELEVSI
jgi:hypothetical protein